MRVLYTTFLIALVGCLTTTQVAGEMSCIVPSDAAHNAPSTKQVVGHYRAVSESEWSLEVWLYPDGKAEVLWEWWHAGQFDERTSTRYRGKWSLVRGFVALEYGGRCETLAFNSSLSFAEFGFEGAAPGLKGIHSSVSNNLFVGRSLWRADSLQQIPDPG